MKKLLISAFVLVQVVTLAGVSANFASAAYSQCSDGFNNDPQQDSLIDAADPGCHTDGNAGNSNSYNPNINSELLAGQGSGGGSATGTTQCSDGINNDPQQDALVDAQDPGCHTDGNAANAASYNANINSELLAGQGGGGGSTSNPQCSDGIDNDGQQGADQSDPDCYSGAGGSYNPNDNTEFGSCISGGCNPPPSNTCPAISNLGSSYSATVGVQFSADANAFDAEGDSFSFSLTQAPAGMVINSATGVITWTPNSSQAGQQFTVTVRTTDSRGASCQSSFTVQVAPENRPPVCPAFSEQYPTYTVSVGQNFSLPINATDPDGDSISYSLVNGPSGAFMSGNVFSWTPNSSHANNTNTSYYTVTFRATDSRQASCQVAITIGVPPIPPQANHPPVCTNIPNRTVTVGNQTSFRLSVSDQDNESVSVNSVGIPSGMNYLVLPTPINQIIRDYYWTPSANQIGNWPMIFQVVDARGATDTCTTAILVNAAPVSPVQTTNTNNNNNTNNNTNNNNNVVNVNVTGGGGGGGSTMNSCNDGIDNDGDGRIDYNDPGCQQGGNEWYNSNPPAQYQCSDNFDNDGDGRVDMNDPDCSSYYDNSEFGGTVLAQCRDGIDNDADGRVDYPNDPGCYGYDDPSESDGTGTGVPVITSVAPTTASEGQQYVYDVNAFDPESQPITYSLAISPSGMIINSVTGLITWTPDFSQGGISYFVSVRASDGFYAATQNYIIAVTDLNPAPLPPPPGPGPAPIVELRIFNVRLTNDATGNVLATFETTLPANGSIRFGTVSEAERFNNFTYPMTGQNQTVGVTVHQINLGVIPLNQTHYLRAFATVGTQGAVTAELAFVQLTTGIVGPGQVGQVQGDQTLASAFATIGHWIISPSFLLFLVIILLIALIAALTRRRSVMTTSGPIEIHS